MAKFPMDLSKFKKVKSDKSTTTLRHPEGHEITLAHGALQPKFREQLAALPMAETKKLSKKEPAPVKMANGGIMDDVKQLAPMAMQLAPLLMADGGDVPSSDNPPAPPQQAPAQPTIVINAGGPSQAQVPPQVSAPQPAAPAQPDPNAIDYSKVTSDDSAPYGTGTAAAQQIAAQAQPAASAPTLAANATPATAPAPNASDPFGTEAYYGAVQRGLDEQKAGIAGEAQATGDQGKQEAATLQQNIQSQQDAQRTYQQHYSDLDRERQSFQQDYQNQHIDPQHYLNSMGTGQRISTAIGLILGGMGGGLTHQENPALKFLNNQIDRDITSQQAEMGKRENLLNANMRQFGNLRDATDMTRVMQSDIVSNQLKQAAAKAMDPMAKARALQAAGQLDMQSAPVLSQIAMRRTLLSGMNGGRVAPESVVRMIVPQGQQEAAYKELQTSQNMQKMRDNVLSAYDQVNQMSLGGSFSPKQRDALVQPVLAQMVKDSEGRVTPTDTKMIESLFPSATDGGADTRAVKRAQLTKFLSEKMHFPMLKAYGIDLSNGGRYGAQGQSRIQESAPVIK